MKNRSFATSKKVAVSSLLALAFLVPMRGFSQYREVASLHEMQYQETEHQRAEREQTARDHQNHTGAKVVGGTAAGGAVVGALAGGGKGALIGGAVGAGGGAVANKVRKDKAVKKRERTNQ